VTVDDGSTTADCDVVVDDGDSCAGAGPDFDVLPNSPPPLEIGETQQFRSWYDVDCAAGPGAPVDVTDLSTWISSVPAYASETATAGLFIGNSAGTTNIQADYNPGGSGNLSDSSPLTVEDTSANPQCSDGEDNDLDGFTDYDGDGGDPDPGCIDANDDDESEECSDTFDNDGDGNADYPNDLECLSPVDNDEQGEPRFEEF
jgi:hypothetical protein